MYACVGLWNMMFLLLYAVSDASRLMKWSTRLESMDCVIRRCTGNFDLFGKTSFN